MKLIKKHMTLEEYETKYPKYQTKLLSFSDKEIKEFNDKFYKNNGSKQIPDKYALLNKGKWVHIKDRYYQIPQTGKKIGIAGGCAVAVAAAIALPIILLNNVTLNEQEFKDVLTWFATPSEDRKFTIEDGTLSIAGMGKDSVNKDDDTEVVTINSQIEGYKEKTIMAYPDGSDPENIVTYFDKESKITYTYNNEYNPETKKYDEYHWRYYSPKKPLFSDFITGDFLTYSKNYSKFKKKGFDTYTVSNIEVPTVIEIIAPAFKGLKGTANAYISFNKDKTIKAVKEEVKIDLSKIYPTYGKVITLTSDYKIKDIGTHTIADFPEFKKTEVDNVYNMYGGEGSIYSYFYVDYLKGGIQSTFKIEVVDDYSIDEFVIGINDDSPLNFDSYYDFSKSTFEVYINGEKDETAHLSDDKCSILFTETRNIDPEGDNPVVEIKVTPNEDIDNFSEAIGSLSVFPLRTLITYNNNEYKTESSLASSINRYEFDVQIVSDANVGVFKIMDSSKTKYFNDYEVVDAYISGKRIGFTQKEDANNNIWYEFDEPIKAAEASDLMIVVNINETIPDNYYAYCDSIDEPTVNELTYGSDKYSATLSSGIAADTKYVFNAIVDEKMKMV